MGWTGFHKEKGLPMVDFFQREFGETYEIVESSFVNFTEFYAAVRHPEGYTFGMVVLVRFDQDPYWNIYYKDMDESMGPSYYNAPRKVLEALTEYEGLSEWAMQWREACWNRVKYRESLPSVSKGDMVVFKEPITFTSGRQEDHFIYEKGATFRDPRASYLRYKITKWRDRGYMVVPKPRDYEPTS